MKPRTYSAATHYYLGTRMLGTVETYPLSSEGKPAIWFCPQAYFCPICGDIWGRAITPAVQAEGWVLQHTLCAAHGDGSFLASHAYPSDWIATASRELAIYELTLPAYMSGNIPHPDDSLIFPTRKWNFTERTPL